jgi:hypothetical protein
MRNLAVFAIDYFGLSVSQHSILLNDLVAMRLVGHQFSLSLSPVATGYVFDQTFDAAFGAHP